MGQNQDDIGPIRGVALHPETRNRIICRDCQIFLALALIIVLNVM
jgi:hypothetical protein